MTEETPKVVSITNEKGSINNQSNQQEQLSEKDMKDIAAQFVKENKESLSSLKISDNKEVNSNEAIPKVNIETEKGNVGR